MLDPLLAERGTIWGHAGDPIPAYLARPLGGGPYPGIVVIHHMPGWDEATWEIVRRFAAHGYVAISPHLHHRGRAGRGPGRCGHGSSGQRRRPRRAFCR